MTERQEKLLNLLKSEPDKWFTQKEICESISDYTFKERNNDKCSQIRDDKVAINADKEVDSLIVMKDYKFKIGTYDEYRRERYAHVRRLKNQASEIANMDFKFRRNNQGKVFDENEFYTTFAN